MSVTRRDKAELGLPLNYLTNGGGESGTTGWSAFNTTFTNGIPGTITSGSTKLSVVAVTINVLAGNGSLQMHVTTASGATGHGIISSALTIKDADLGKMLAVAFDYNFVTNPGNVDCSGTSTQTIEVWVYNVGRATWYQPAGFRSINTKGTSTQLVPGRTPSITFQSDISNTSNNNQYQVALIIRNDPAGTFDMNFDNVTFGRQSVAMGPAVTDWKSYPLIIGAVTTAPTPGTNTSLAEWRQVGDSMEITYEFAQTSAGSTGSGTYLFPLPLGAIDTTKIVTTTNAIGAGGTALGTATVYTTNTSASTFAFTGTVYAYDATHLFIVSNTTTFGQLQPVGSGAFQLSSNPLYYSFNVRVPIAGWSSSLQLSSDTDTRVVAAEYTSVDGATLPSGNIINYGTKNIDTHSAVTVGVNSWKFQVPVSGVYCIIATIYNTSSSQVGISINKNGSNVAASFSPSSGGTSVQSSVIVQCVAGDTINATMSGASLSLSSATGQNTISISKISGPSVIAANETVSASYYLAANTSVTANNPVPWDTKEWDDHGIISGGSATIPVNGKYLITGLFQYSTSGGTNLKLYKNGSFVRYLQAASTNLEATYSQIIRCICGDIIDVRTADTGTVVGTQTGSSFQILRVGNY